MRAVIEMSPKNLLPPNNIAFYNSDRRFRPFIGQDNNFDTIDIFEYGPWQYPCEDKSICARYVIGISTDGYHWDTEFVIGADKNLENQTLSERAESQAHEFNWSPASTFADLAVKHARRCITIQAKTISLDKTTKIKLTLEPGQVSYMDIDKVPMNKRLAFSVEQNDLQRLAIYNGYLSWSEYENGTLDFRQG